MKEKRHKHCPLNVAEERLVKAIVSLGEGNIYHDEIKAISSWCPPHKYSGYISSISRKGYITTGRGPGRRCYCRVIE